MKQMKFPAAPVWDINLSAPASIVYWHSKDQGPEQVRRSVELVIYAAYCTGYHHFYNVGKANMPQLLTSQHPFLDMHQKTMAKFDGVAFGDCQSGCQNPTGLNFKGVYLNESGAMNGMINAVVDCILGVLHWINETIGTDKFHHVNIEAQVKKCLEELKDKCTTTDFGEFWLMLVVQICCLVKVIVKGHKDLHNLVYPVASLGAAAQLSHVHASERPDILDLIVRENGLKDYGRNSAEGSLCKMSEKRIGKIFDYMFLGQLLL